ncbi:hypothetical protein L7F22_040693 [Adiantum nelumboides]|nr:hypothetical protein [Adiantum nelumboides]
MKQSLASSAKDKVLTEWKSLKLTHYESIHKYVDKFWDLHLKATVYKKIVFEEQKQQFCAGLLEDMNEYVNSQRPKSISTVIHHTMVAARIKFQQGAKRNLKPMEAKDKQEYKGKFLVLTTTAAASSSNTARRAFCCCKSQQVMAPSAVSSFIVVLLLVMMSWANTAMAQAESPAPPPASAAEFTSPGVLSLAFASVFSLFTVLFN